MMTILSWLFAGMAAKRRDLSSVDREIAEKSKSIEETDRDIESVRPHVSEAIKRTEDAYYRLRSRVKSAERRIDKAQAEMLIRDIEKGWRRRDDS